MQYVPERLSKFGHPFPISTKEMVAVIQNPAQSNYEDILYMPGEIPLCLVSIFFFVFTWVLRKKQLRIKFPFYRPVALFNWQFYNIIFGIVIGYLTGIISINQSRNPTPKLPFQTFEELQLLVLKNQITPVTIGVSANVLTLNNSFPQGSLLFIKSVLQGLELVSRDRTKVYLGWPSSISIDMNRFDCKLVMVSDRSFPAMNTGILYSKLAPDWLRNFSLPTIIAMRAMYEKYQRKYRLNSVDFSCMDTPLRPLKILQIRSSFYLMASGLGIAGIVLTTEFLLGHRRRIQQYGVTTNIKH